MVQLSIGNGSSMSGGTPYLRSENFDSAHIDSVRQLLAQLCDFASLVYTCIHTWTQIAQSAAL